MGFFKTLFAVVFPAIGFSVYSSFRLGKELPKASRRLGQNIGMSYNYFKVVLKLLVPANQQPGETMDVFRKANQQAAAFSREFKTNILKSQHMLKDAMPKELTTNPLDSLGLLTPDQPIEENKGDVLRGSNLLSLISQEKARLKKKQSEKAQTQKFYEKF